MSMAAADPSVASASKLAARAARFSNKLPGNRYKELEELRQEERRDYERQGLIKVGKTELEDAVEMRGTCEKMCSDYEREFREYTREIHPFEAGSDKRMDPGKAVAAYSRSDAGAGHGDSAILPSDLRTPTTLVQTLDYLFSTVMSAPPPSSSDLPLAVMQRKALSYSAGFIRDRTRAIRKEFAMQSSWGHDEAIASFERIARWHILCLRELQEEGGTNNDMHIDSAELGRCFTSLRQHYNDRREELGVEMPCANEPEFRAYMLIYDLNNKSVSIPTSELPCSILEHPLVRLAWDIRRSAQRNFDSQKEGSKLNAELGANMINRYIRLLKQEKLPYLLGCLVEIRLRELRRSALRALTRAYPRLRTEPIRLNDAGEVIERRMILLSTLNSLLGCEPQDTDPSAWDDVPPASYSPSDESVAICERFNIPVYRDESGNAIGALINLGTAFDDNKDAPYTRKWALISEKRGSASFVDVVNGLRGVDAEGEEWSIPSQTIGHDARAATGTTKSAFRFGKTNSVIPSASSTLPASFNFRPPQDVESHARLTTDSSKQPASTSAFNFYKPPFPVITSATTSSQPLPTPVGKGEISIKVAPFSSSSLPPKMEETQSRPPSFTSQTQTKGTVPSGAGFSFSFAASKTSEQPDEQKNWRGETAKIEVPKDKKPAFSFEAIKPASTAQFAAATLGLPVATNAAKGTTKPIISSPTTPNSLLPVPTGAEHSKTSTFKPSTIIHERKDPTLLFSTSITPPLSKSTSITSVLNHTRRQARKTALPYVCEQIIQEAMQQIIENHQGQEIESLVKQQVAERAYKQRKLWRRITIQRWTEQVFETMIENEARRIAYRPLLREIKRRRLIRQVVAHWRVYTQKSKEKKERGGEKRVERFEKLQAMGLSRSLMKSVVGKRHQTQSTLMSNRVIENDTDMASVSDLTKLDSLTIDIEIIQAERNKDNFFASSTFLTSIARQVSPQISSVYPTLTCSFVTLLSTPPTQLESYGSPPDQQVQEWLNNKFCSPKVSTQSGETPALESHSLGGVEFSTLLVHDGTLQQEGWTGMVIFEAPLKTQDSRKAVENIASAQDRIGLFVKLLQDNANRYVPALIVLTWEDETMEELGGRLQIQSELSAFDSKAIISLENSEDLDQRFNKALMTVLDNVNIKEQVVVRLQDVVEAVYIYYEQFVDISNMVLLQRCDDACISWKIFRYGIELINLIPKLLREEVGPNGLKDDENFASIVLPVANTELPNSIEDLLDRVAKYLDNDALEEIDNLDILLTRLSQAAHNKLSLPIGTILQSLSILVLGELRHQYLYTQIYLPQRRDIETWKRQYVERICNVYQVESEKRIQWITSFLSSSMNTTSTSPTSISETLPIDHKPSSKKRARSEREERSSIKNNKKKESKAAKAARLLRVMKRVEKTLSSNENVVA
ncbi:uncharacterized protein L203_105398 [Cryptococcus depauperatus CBS 7841]|uniref:SAC3/GANP/THP3 conserved domain-containing protein n=1 Tax=Cryptococcus depauperatus CBS 7841 TaxID=1295531 RepID=A0AAJ8JXD2_9TREE